MQPEGEKWTGIRSSMACVKASASGGQPTGTTALATQVRINETPSPSKQICTSCPAAANAFACRNGNAAFVGSSEPQALLIRTLLMLASQVAASRIDRLAWNLRIPFAQPLTASPESFSPPAARDA